MCGKCWITGWFSGPRSFLFSIEVVLTFLHSLQGSYLTSLPYGYKRSFGRHLPHLLSSRPHNEAALTSVPPSPPVEGGPLPQSHSVPFSPWSQPMSISTPSLYRLPFLPFVSSLSSFFFWPLILLIRAHSYFSFSILRYNSYALNFSILQCTVQSIQ